MKDSIVNPKTVTQLMEMLEFPMKTFFNDDGTLKSHLELAVEADGNHCSLPYTLADYHHQVTTMMKDLPPAERFTVFVQAISQNGDPRAILFNFLRAIVGSIDAGKGQLLPKRAA